MAFNGTWGRGRSPSLFPATILYALHSASLRGTLVFLGIAAIHSAAPVLVDTSWNGFFIVRMF